MKLRWSDVGWIGGGVMLDETMMEAKVERNETKSKVKGEEWPPLGAIKQHNLYNQPSNNINEENEDYTENEDCTTSPTSLQARNGLACDGSRAKVLQNFHQQCPQAPSALPASV